MSHPLQTRLSFLYRSLFLDPAPSISPEGTADPIPAANGTYSTADKALRHLQGATSLSTFHVTVRILRQNITSPTTATSPSVGCVTTIKNVIVNRLCHHYQKRYCQQAASPLSKRHCQQAASSLSKTLLSTGCVTTIKTSLSTGCVTTIKNIIVNRLSNRQHAMSPTKYYATVNILRHRQQVASTCYVNKRHSQSINQCLSQ